MALTQQATQDVGAVYSLEGTLLEVCSCNVLCPCWIGEDPDGGECFSVNACHIDRGQITGVDVSGRSATRWSRPWAGSSAGRWPTSPDSTAPSRPSRASPSATRSAAAPGPFGFPGRGQQRHPGRLEDGAHRMRVTQSQARYPNRNTGDRS
jgi:Protein of unknown function (DUF1326)